MRFGILTLLTLISLASQAQIQQSTENPHASVSIQSTLDQFGAFAEFFVKPKVSVWASFGTHKSSSQLGFGEDTTSTNLFTPPLETVYYSDLQQRITIRLGARFYQSTRKGKWSIWYSPVLGYSNLSAPSEDYQMAYQREDLHYLSISLAERKAKRSIELGGEIGSRWSFLQLSKLGLYAEGSVFMLGERSLLEKNSFRDYIGLHLRAAIGITF